MDLIDYEIHNSDDKILVFLKVSEFNKSYKLEYTQLNNILYKINTGWCISDRKGKALAIRQTLPECAEFLNSLYNKRFNTIHNSLSICDADTKED